MTYYIDDQIAIRDIEDEDISPMFSWWLDKSLNIHDPRPFPCSPESLLKECKWFSERFKTEIMNSDNSKNKYKYYVITNNRNVAIGFVNAFSFNSENKSAELGIMIGDKTYWRCGVAEKSMAIAIEDIFNDGKCERLYVETGKNNIAAIKLSEKLGFVKCDEYEEEGGFKFVVMEKFKVI